ncbi:MAG: hypothetical protein E7635_03065 [Ruminococcaceae bacterium]|nr:hypothetical protein [Oscillospiraceae bacterium]
MNDNNNIIRTNDKPSKMNKYYESVAISFRYAKFIILFFTILFLMAILSFFRDEVSIENFQYMLKYMTSEDNTFITTQKIHYPTSDSKALEIFAGDFASAGTNGITLYDTNGNTVLDIDTVLSNPVFAVGKKYGLCYDLSGYNYVVFNTFSKLSHNELEYPISDAAIDNSGNYAILSKDKEYRSIIYVYDSDFDLVSKIYKNKYTFDLDINPKQIAYVTAEALDARFLTKLNVIEHNSDIETTVASIYDEFPLAVNFLDKSIVMITDKSLRIYSNDKDEFGEISKYSFSANSPGGYAVSDKLVMLYFKKNTIGSENEIKMYSSDGSFMFTTTLYGKINSIDINDHYAIVQTAEKIYKIGMESKKIDVVSIEAGAEKAILQADSSVLACYKNYAKLVDFTNTEDSFYIDITEGK